MNRAPILLEVPAGTPSKPCRGRGCTAVIYFVGKAPVHCDVPNGKRPTDTEGGVGVNHFTDCKDANDFHRPRKNGAQR